MSVFDLYRRADDFLVEKANDVVKAWNWTTGRTRADLAATIGNGGCMAIIASAVMRENVVAAALLTGGYLTLAEQANERLQDVDRREAAALRLQAKDETVERNKQTMQTVSLTSTGIAVIDLIPNTNNTIHPIGLTDYQCWLVTSGGLLGIAASGYIMRADYQKPQKDCISRGIKRLKEMHAQSTALQPTPVNCYELAPIG